MQIDLSFYSILFPKNWFQVSGFGPPWRDMEYPIDLNKINPITAEIHNTKLTINTEISDVYSTQNKLYIEIIPTAQKKVPSQ